MNFLIFLGSARESTPPKPARLGARVSEFTLNSLNALYPEHQAEVIDVLDYPLDAVFKPHFAYPSGKAPQALNSLAEKIKAADGYLMVSPEYNHTMSPALSHLLNHFGSSLFAYKPSAIVTYSAGQWGGMRAAIGMRSFLSELGCLPVSAMIHVPKAQQVFTAEGEVQPEEDESRWQDYFGRTLSQLIWWAQATKEHRAQVDPHSLIRSFKKDPSERNAP
ncbi:NADPH-dependent FMN reductase [Reinekea marinisedimentorum]|uniref:NAD(P)H-dependent FMN reductase n=1 Tax=Reinekea marinisedimentorum TaxID=230495 RepID=A0A4R3I3A1_9GAMM|nr:NAD(P)H-dependent oxidoreductase [Reinekea marinisedimentorum]TCS39764.1 NAD(P)H-dependent FMN reductase [Reinekea marinisedimentorum]